jgi:hypothetical protein
MPLLILGRGIAKPPAARCAMHCRRETARLSARRNALTETLYLDEKVFELVAKFPMKRMEPGVPQQGPPFDFQEFLKQLGPE